MVALCIFMSGYILSQKSETLTVSAENLSGYINSMYQSQMNGIISTAENQTIKDYLLDPNDPENYNQARQAFYGSFNIYNIAAKSALLKTDGTVLMTSETEETFNSAENQTLIEEAVSSEKEVILLGFEDDTPLMIIGYPIRNSNNEIAAIYKRVAPLTYVGFYATNANQNNENVLIISHTGNGIYYRTDLNEEPENLYIEDISRNNVEIVQDLTGILDRYMTTGANPSGTVNYSTQTFDALGGYSTVPDVNWIVLVSQPKFLIYYDLNLFQLSVIVLALIFLIIISSFAQNYLYKYIAPITTFNKRIRELMNGNYSMRFPDEQPGFIGELGEGLNEMATQIEQDNIYKAELEYQLNDLLTIDQITGLYNNRAFYNFIDQAFDNSDNQAIVLLETGAYDQINETFGNNVSNRLLEIITEAIESFRDEHTFPARFSKDIFAIYIDDVADPLILNEKLHELELKLQSITNIDDLQVQLDPHIGVVFKDKHLLGRSDWLRLCIETLREAKTDNVGIRILDFTDLDELQKEKPELFDNIFSIHNDPIQGFSKSNKEA